MEDRVTSELGLGLKAPGKHITFLMTIRQEGVDVSRKVGGKKLHKLPIPAEDSIERRKGKLPPSSAASKQELNIIRSHISQRPYQ